MSIFEFCDYKQYLKRRLQEMPKQGRGELQRISQHLKMHSTRFSHIFNGNEHLTLEQGLGLAQYLGLNELESEYFMVLLARSGPCRHPIPEACRRGFRGDVGVHSGGMSARIPESVGA